MRIVSWNIRSGAGRRCDAIANQIAVWRPDIVALSEFRGTPPSLRLAARLTALGLSYQATTADPALPSVNSLLLASGEPFELEAPGRTFPMPARWLGAQFEGLTLGVVHIPNRDSGKKPEFIAAVAAAARYWRDEPAIIVGDTNSGRPRLDDEHGLFGGVEERLFDAIEGCGWADAFRALEPEGRAYTWYSHRNNGFRLDQAFLSAPLLHGLRAVRHEWGQPPGGSERREALSDHAALIVELDGV
jgi:exonuclease III